MYEPSEGGLCENNMQGETWDVANSTEECSFGIYCFEDGHDVPETPALTRFPKGHLIPVYFREKEDQRFINSMNHIESLVGYKMFDRKGVVTIDMTDPSNIDLTHLDTKWGLILSQGTSAGDMSGSGYCSLGNVAVGPYVTTPGSYIVSTDYGIKYPAKEWGRDGNFTWVNLDSLQGANDGKITCNGTAPQDVATHEFAHALGMQNHFSGFGFDGAWGKNAERVLKTMYSDQNLPGQPFDSLFIED
ncbi:hypothetical protein JCM19237_5143 [Photobacterium aphoticum]|uniref:Peptidase M10 metallopeptidase domain-containing protein n=1 Tax=Photobacterium aphoticum TaxID=754436 RepID=A0A090QGH4_9GAMM|nr:hypothetical protein JCM19237_5143 [Photobacterium aphoticum]